MKTVLFGALLVLAFACGKNKSGDSSSSSSVFRSGLSSCEKSLVIIPMSPSILPSVVAGSRTYQVGQGTSQQAWQTLTMMYYGQAGVQPYTQSASEKRYRATVCATPSTYGYGGYGGYGGQQPINSNALDIQSLQPY